ncbi:hypothetical protein [Actinomadura logoneensis]|uniref:hypothetical protein n=1 Tax=Actinomadura logoneensis TaxID=2293572 RepID=UPI0011C0F334|nr:hypothetical protein [Actinomadura logoneensis]
MNQGGHVGGHNVQIDAEGDVTVNLSSGDASGSGRSGGSGGEAAGEKKKTSPWAWLLALTVGVLLLVAALRQQADPDADNGAFVLPGDRWPAGATLEAIAGPAAAALRSCAKATSTEPVNCPQRAGGRNDQVSDVRWELFGDPVDGARATYHDGRFDLIGHAFMTVTYRTLTATVIEQHPVRFRASVAWRNGAAELVGRIRPTKVEPKDRPITKQRPPAAVTGRLEPVLRQAFADCLAARRSPLPPGCPQDVLPGFRAGNVDWVFDGDPLQNTRTTTDDAWGVIRVKGDFALNATYRDLFGKETGSLRGAYEATVVTVKDGLRVVQISKA